MIYAFRADQDAALDHDLDSPLLTTNPGDFSGLEHLLTVVPVTRPHVPHHAPLRP